MKRITRKKTKNPDLTDEIVTKKKDKMQLYPYFIIAGVMVLLITGGSLLFRFLPDFKDRIHIQPVASQTTFYTDESMLFFGLDIDENEYSFTRVNEFGEDEELFCRRISRIVSTYDESAKPSDEAVLLKSMTVYDSFEEKRDTPPANDYDTYESDQSSDSVSVSGKLYVINNCVYSTDDEKDYSLSIVADDETIYFFKLDEVHDSDIGSREFYQVLDGLNLDIWRETSAKMKTGYDEVMYNYNIGMMYYYDIASALQPYIDVLDSNELSEFYAKINKLSYPDENYSFICSFEKLDMPSFFGKLIENTGLVDNSCLDGSSIVIYNPEPVIGSYHLGYIYDLHSGKIIGFGLCR